MNETRFAGRVGLFVALYLWLHALGYGGAIKCGASGGCETVQTSPWAVFLGGRQNPGSD